MDVAERVHVAFAVVEEEEVRGDASEEGGGGEEKGGHGALVCTSRLGAGLWLTEMVKGRDGLPLCLCQVTRWPEVEQQHE